MNFVTTLFVLFSTIYLIQAKNLELTLLSYYFENENINPKIDLTLIGEKTTKVISFNDSNLFKVGIFSQKTEFPESIKKVTIYWKNDSNKSLLVHDLSIKFDNESTEMFFMDKYIQSGTTETFRQLNNSF